MAKQNITDLSYLHEISMGDDELVAEMIALFLENVPRSIKRLKTLVQQEEWDEVASITHRLKPNLAYVGLDSAKAIIEHIEKRARVGNNAIGKNNMSVEILRLEQLCRQSYKELNEALKELGS